jgi:SnoaL-like domain
MTDIETDAEVRSWLDRLAIQDLIYRHSDAVTRADWRQLEALYAPDAIWEEPALGLRFDSAAAFVAMLEGTTSMEAIVQTAHAPVINLITQDKAQATSTFHEWSRGITSIDAVVGGDAVRQGDEVNVEEYGVYYDDLARIDGDWKFTHRRAVLIYMTSGSMTGDVLTPRSALLRPE